MKNIFLMLTAVLFVSLISCSDDTDNPANTSFFPMTAGSYWVYEDFELDTAGAIVEDSKTMDSTVISGTTTKYNQTAYIFMSYLDGGTSDSSFFYATTSQLFAASDFLNPGADMVLPIEIPDGWYKLVDNDLAEFTIFSQTLTNESVTLPGVGDFTVNGTINIKAKKGQTTQISYGENNSKSAECTDFQFIYEFTGTISIAGIPLPLQTSFAAVNHLWYSKGIGLVKRKMDSFTVSVGGLYNMDMNGNESTLIRYKIK